jgi:hypothetical protein
MDSLSIEKQLEVNTFERVVDGLAFTEANFRELQEICKGLKRLEVGQRAFLADQVKEFWGRPL